MTEETVVPQETLTITEATGGETLTDLVLRLTREKNELQATLDIQVAARDELAQRVINLQKDVDGMQSQIATPVFELAKMIDQLIALRLEEFVETDTFTDGVEAIADRVAERHLDEIEAEDDYDNWKFGDAVRNIVEDMDVVDDDKVRDMVSDILSNATISI